MTEMLLAAINVNAAGGRKITAPRVRDARASRITHSHHPPAPAPEGNSDVIQIKKIASRRSFVGRSGVDGTFRRQTTDGGAPHVCQMGLVGPGKRSEERGGWVGLRYATIL